MAAYTKGAAPTLLASTTNAAGATTTSGTLTLTTQWAPLITWQVTNGGTAPARACTITLNHSPDGGTTWYPVATRTANIAAGAVSTGSFGTREVPDGTQLLQVVFTGNTGQAVTVAAQAVFATAFA